MGWLTDNPNVWGPLLIVGITAGFVAALAAMDGIVKALIDICDAITDARPVVAWKIWRRDRREAKWPEAWTVWHSWPGLTHRVAWDVCPTRYHAEESARRFRAMVIDRTGNEPNATATIERTR